MKIHLIAVGKHLPGWVNDGYQDYAKRLPATFKMQLHEISALKRTKGIDYNRLLEQEGQAILAAIPAGSHIIALDRLGVSWDTLTLAQKMQQWQEEYRDISLLIGGPEGLAPSLLKQAHITWSLSKLTLPHPLVRIVIAEQLYRAWSILIKHPYHR